MRARLKGLLDGAQAQRNMLNDGSVGTRKQRGRALRALREIEDKSSRGGVELRAIIEKRKQAKIREGAAKQHAQNEIDFAKAQDQMLMDMKSVERTGAEMGLSDEETSGFVADISSNSMSVKEARSAMREIRRRRESDEEAATGRSVKEAKAAAAEDKIASGRIAFEKARGNIKLTSDEGALIDNALARNDFTNAWQVLTTANARIVRTLKTKGVDLVSPGSGGTKAAFKAPAAGLPEKLQPDVLRGISEEGVALDLANPRMDPSRAKQLINGKWDMEGKDKRARLAKAEDIVTRLQDRGYDKGVIDAVAAQLADAWGLELSGG